MKKISLGLLGTLLLTTACQQPGFAPRGAFNPNVPRLRAQTASTTALPSVENRVIIAYQGQLSPAKIQEIEQKNGLKFHKNIPQIKVAVFSGQSRNPVQSLSQDPAIVVASGDSRPRPIEGNPQLVQPPISRGSEDPLKGDQWSLKAVDAEKAWGISKGKNNVIVGIVDTGVDLQHEDLAPNLLKGYNAVKPGQPPQDSGYHGTHVAGIVGAVSDNGKGVTGIAPQVKLLPVQVLARGAGVAEVTDGIVWAVDNGSKVINLSLGWDYPSPAVEEAFKRAVKYALDKNVVICAAMSNSSRFNPKSVPDNLANKPGFEGVIGVGNVDINDRRQGAYGDWKSVSSPGTKILSTMPGNKYGNLTGTSMATPMVAGISALIISQNPGIKNTEVKRRIMATAFDLGDKGMDDQFGAGRINAFQVLRIK